MPKREPTPRSLLHVCAHCAGVARRSFGMVSVFCAVRKAVVDDPSPPSAGRCWHCFGVNPALTRSFGLHNVRLPKQRPAAPHCKGADDACLHTSGRVCLDELHQFVRGGEGVCGHAVRPQTDASFHVPWCILCLTLGFGNCRPHCIVSRSYQRTCVKRRHKRVHRGGQSSVLSTIRRSLGLFRSRQPHRSQVASIVTRPRS